MHFHLPKPLHGWREFAGEVGIIVVGVLIALGAEQVVEGLHQRAELGDAIGAMTTELRDDDLPQAFARVAVSQCLDEQLDAIVASATSGADRSKLLAMARLYLPQYRSWDDQAWKAALNSQAFVHSGPENMIAWSTPYIFMPVLTQFTTNEQAELPEFRAELEGTGPLSGAELHELFRMVERLRYDNLRMRGASHALLASAQDRVGVSIPPSQRAQVLADARHIYTDGCVSVRAKASPNGASQFQEVQSQ
jgi:hypothetical protein